MLVVFLPALLSLKSDTRPGEPVSAGDCGSEAGGAGAMGDMELDEPCDDMLTSELPDVLSAVIRLCPVSVVGCGHKEKEMK